MSWEFVRFFGELKLKLHSRGFVLEPREKIILEMRGLSVRFVVLRVKRRKRNRLLAHILANGCS